MNLLLTPPERKLVAARSALWVGPTTWGFHRGYRLSLPEILRQPGFG